MALIKRAWIVLLSAAALVPPAPAQRPALPDAGELEAAVQKLGVLGSVLYVGAHPDDENTAVLAALSKGRKYRTAYLSVTRGEGGQNLIGPEQGPAIGLLRTQELLAARRIDGAEQFFTWAIDFGYSKTAEESFAFWGRESVLGDIVWVIRIFRPDVIMTRFSIGGGGGHGHHTATAELIKDAFAAAADPAAFPEQLPHAPAWQAKRLLANRGRPRPGEGLAALRLNTGHYDPLLGKSYAEMAGESRSQHKSQGFGSAGRRGEQFDAFDLMAGDQAAADIFDGIDVSWNRVPGGKTVGALLAACQASFDPRDPARSIPGLLEARAEMEKLGDGAWVRLKMDETARVIQACAGLWLEAIADDYAAAPGDEVLIRTTALNRSDAPFTLHRQGFSGLAPDAVVDRPLKNNEVVTVEQKVLIPKGHPISQPYWLEDDTSAAGSPAGDWHLRGRAENPPALSVKVAVAAGGHLLEYDVPVLYRWTDPAEGELYRRFEVRPRATLRLEDGVKIFPDETVRPVRITVRSQSRSVAGSVRLTGPDGWRISPASVPFSLPGKYEEAEVTFEVSPAKAAGEAVLTAAADIDGERVGRDAVEIYYPHIERRTYFPESKVKAVKLDVLTAGQKIGYIMGAGDEVAKSLGLLGYEVTMLTDEMLETGDLAAYDAIVAGVRAFNTRDRLGRLKGRLLQYVEQGGTFIVQYNVPSAALAGQIGPFPLTVGRDRVTMEDAPVSFPIPGHPLLNAPNKITAADFDGWVQERGLYFASDWDAHYDAILSSHDPGEPERAGGLLVGRFGRGVFIYTAYAWFRQLPAGVPGAFRIFANLIAAGKTLGSPSAGKD